MIVGLLVVSGFIFPRVTVYDFEGLVYLEALSFE